MCLLLLWFSHQSIVSLQFLLVLYCQNSDLKEKTKLAPFKEFCNSICFAIHKQPICIQKDTCPTRYGKTLNLLAWLDWGDLGTCFNWSRGTLITSTSLTNSCWMWKPKAMLQWIDDICGFELFRPSSGKRIRLMGQFYIPEDSILILKYIGLVMSFCETI
jgi:hypothetical protein